MATKLLCDIRSSGSALLSINRSWMKSNRFFSATTDERNSEPTEFIDYLNSLTNYEKLGVPERAGTDSKEGLDLGRMRRLLQCLDNPQSKFMSVHIAGTKGKGSTAAFIASILRSEGYSVGCYTSPHLLSILERMTLGAFGEPVSAEDLTNLFHKIKPNLDKAIVNENGNLTHFEILTATAFSLFADKNVDIAIIEAGLGGARDATNVIAPSELACAVITTIGEEHMRALGGSLETIAAAKAGIIKNNRPVILGGPFQPHIERMIREKAAALNSLVICSNDAGSASSLKDMRVPFLHCNVKIENKAYPYLSLELPDVKLRMLGRHQLRNALTGACTVLSLRNEGWMVSNKSIREGLERAYMPGRFQILSAREADAIGLSGVAVLLDGAHTKDSAKAVAETVRYAYPEGDVVLVVAMANDKDHSSFAREMLMGIRRVAGVVLTEVAVAGGSDRSTPATILRDRWKETADELGVESEIVDVDLVQGCVVEVKRMVSCLRLSKQRVVVVTGSLHAVAGFLSLVRK